MASENFAKFCEVWDREQPVHEEIVVDEIHYNGNYMIKIGE